MMKYLAGLVGLLMATVSWSQDQTYETESELGSKPDFMIGEVLVIPFSPLLYKCQFNRALESANGIEASAIRDSFRIRLSRKLQLAMDTVYTNVSLLSSNSRMTADLEVIYNNLNYHYTELPMPEAAGKMEKWKRKLKKKEAQNEAGTRIENGQIVTVQSKRERYMAATIQDAAVMTVIGKTYQSNYFLLVNQFEFVVPKKLDQIAIQSGHFPREFQVHYSIVDNRGKEVTGGLIKEQLSSDINMLDDLTGDAFDSIVSQLIQAVPAAQDEMRLEE